ncbi:MAG: succinylglutamate desuccinylase/aspartoacylase family protein [Thioalkalivibrionaceae bacterium]
MKVAKRSVFECGGVHVPVGGRAVIELDLPGLNSHNRLKMPVHVVHGRSDGPRLFVTAAIHGDELNGVEIARRLLQSRSLARLRGTLVVVPVVNVYGLVQQSRYLPDRRDLNRCFPGAADGSLAARVAHLLMQEVVARCTHGIDLHTAAVNRTNLPQVRAHLSDPETVDLARAFGAPVVLESAHRDGSLREAAAEAGLRTLLYEAGEGLRFDELAIRAGLGGILNVMRRLGMLTGRPTRVVPPFVARASMWVRAPESGLICSKVRTGMRVRRGDRMGRISDPYSGAGTDVIAPVSGLVIGRVQLPLVYAGEACFHIARATGDDDLDEVADRVEVFQQEMSDVTPPVL